MGGMNQGAPDGITGNKRTACLPGWPALCVLPSVSLVLVCVHVKTVEAVLCAHVETVEAVYPACASGES